MKKKLRFFEKKFQEYFRNILEIFPKKITKVVKKVGECGSCYSIYTLNT